MHEGRLHISLSPTKAKRSNLGSGRTEEICMKHLFNLKHTIAFISVVFVCTQAHAQLYKWTDAQGNVHFSDTPPNSGKAEDISDSVKRMNISTDLSSPSMIRRAEQAREQDKARESKKRAQNGSARAASKTAHEEYCAAASKRLMDISGPVEFYDEYGERVKVTEQERKQKEKDLRAEIARNCK